VPSVIRLAADDRKTGQHQQYRQLPEARSEIDALCRFGQDHAGVIGSDDVVSFEQRLPAGTLFQIVIAGGAFALVAWRPRLRWVLALGAGLARPGFIANFISEPVLKGFIVELALTIMVGQLPKIFGVSKGSGDFFAQLWHVVDHLGDTSVATLLVGAGSLVVVVGCRLIDRRIPGPPVVVVAGDPRARGDVRLG